MNFENLKAIWQSPANLPSPAQVAVIKTQFLASLRRRHWIFIGFLVWVFSALAACTGMLIYNLSTTQTELSREWAVLPLLVLPWFFAFHFLRQFLRHRRDHLRCRDSILNTLRAALDENRLARSRSRALCVIYVIALPLLALSIHQLSRAGKMASHEIASMLVIFGIALGVSAAWAAYHYYRQLLPRKEELESLLHQYKSSHQ